MEGVRLVNLTPHEITVYTDRGAVFIPPSSLVAGSRLPASKSPGSAIYP
ncbi:MAG: hypothetical protein QW692_05595 [Nitrososphaerota archaeon]